MITHSHTKKNLENNNGNCATYRTKRVEMRTIEQQIFLTKSAHFDHLRSDYVTFVAPQLNGKYRLVTSVSVRLITNIDTLVN